MKKITCISYHGTGSGAVDDFLREFSNVHLASQELECRFLQDPNGISDLYFHLVENWHRLNSGFSIKQYEKFVKMYNHNYSLIFGRGWKIESKKYINSLIKYKFKGYWHADILEVNPFSKCIYKCRRLVSKIMPKKIRKTSDYNYFPKLISYHSLISKEEFLNKTRRYVDDLCSYINDKPDDFVVLDQFIATTNIERYNMFVDDLKIIIVDRDPRDLYISGLCKRWKTHVLPHDVDIFCQQYMDMRKSLDLELKNSNVLKIQFEDLIYNYDSTTNKIVSFLGLNKKNHVRKQEFFNPSISINNTKLWEKYKDYENEIKIIENKLHDYCYFSK